MIPGLFILGAFVICSCLVLLEMLNSEPNEIQPRDWRDE